VLFFLHLQSRHVTLAGITPHPTEAWITQMARNAADETTGALRSCRYLLRDRDAKFCATFHQERNHQGKDNLLLFPARVGRQVREARSVVGSGSAAYSNITAAPHEYFYHTRIPATAGQSTG
jgi:hypothetical protein